MSLDRLHALRAFYEEDPADPFTRFALAQEHRKRGEIGEALRFFEGLLSDDPDYIGTYYHLGKLYESLGRGEEAKRVYRQGIEVAGRLRDAHARAELQDALLQAEGVGDEGDDQALPG